MQRRYETIYIMRSDLSDQEADATINKFQALLTEKGAVGLTLKHLGKRRLAYEIKKQKEGIYIQMNYNAAPTVVAEVEKIMRITDEIIRFLTVRLEDDIAEIPIQPPTEEANAEVGAVS
jgi:small subunit ribosomal protein S6